MSLPEISVRRPVTVIMLVIGIIVLGSVALSRLNLDLLPDIEIPAAAVVIRYEGAGPFEVENLVTRRVEEVLATVENIDSITSRSEGGISTVVALFNWGTNIETAILDIRDRLDIIKPYLPADTEAPLILKFDPNMLPILELGIYGDIPGHELRRIAEDDIKNRLERLEGVASVDIVGGLEREIQVEVDGGKIKAYNIGLDQTIAAIQASNLNLPAGKVTEGFLDYRIRTIGEYESVDEIEDVVVAGGSVGLRKLGDVATVRDTFKDVSVLSRVNGNYSVGLMIQKEAQANTVKVAERVKKELNKMSEDLEKKGAKLIIVADNSIFVKASIDTVKSNAITGGLLAVLVLLVFLRSIGSTLIIAVAIPISIIATFLLIYSRGMSLNIMSLSGLAVGVGMFVDNAIVVLENIYRYREEGLSMKEAAVKGAEEVGLALVASNLTTIVVFLPVIFMEGITSLIFTDLSITITFALLCSLVGSQTLVPVLASRSRLTTAISEKKEERGISKVFGYLPSATYRLADRYAEFLKRILSERRKVFTIAGGLLVLSLALIPVAGKEFLPDMDEGTVRISVVMKRGTILEETNKVVSSLEEEIAKLRYVRDIMSQVGEGERGEEAEITVKLLPKSLRSVATNEAVEDIRNIAKAYPQADINVAGGSIMDVAGGGAPLEIKLRGNDLDLLESQAQFVAEVISKIEGTREVRTSVEELRPELQLKVKRDKASTYGLTVYHIASAARAAINGQVATRFRSGGDEIDVLVRLDEDSRKGLDSVGEVPISTPLGLIIPLKEVVYIQEGYSPTVVERLDQARCVTVSSGIFGRDLGSVVKDSERAIAELSLPEEIDVSFAGDQKWMTEAMDVLYLALVLAVFLVYMILASQFESFWQPFVVIFSIPFAFIGVIWALLLTGQSVNIISFMGVIMLAGIVVNNAIVLIDYINQLRVAGKDREDAIVEAGKTRLRPILMTTLTTVLGMIPMAIGQGVGAEFQRPIGVTVIGGLTVSTILTLIFIPTMFIFIEDLVMGNLKKDGPQGISMDSTHRGAGDIID